MPDGGSLAVGAFVWNVPCDSEHEMTVGHRRCCSDNKSRKRKHRTATGFNNRSDRCKNFRFIFMRPYRLSSKSLTICRMLPQALLQISAPLRDKAKPLHQSSGLIVRGLSLGVPLRRFFVNHRDEILSSLLNLLFLKSLPSE